METLVRVAIVDDDALFGTGLAALLEGAGLTVTGIHSSIAAAVEQIGIERPDVVLVDVMMDGAPVGIELMARLARMDESPAVLALSSFAPRHFVDAARAAGASGYLAKDTDATMLVAAIRLVAGGGRVFPAPRPGEPHEPSQRDMEILAAIAQGLSSEEAGLRLRIGGRTVESHVARMFERYGVSSRTELVLFAARMGWLVAVPTGDARGG